MSTAIDTTLLPATSLVDGGRLLIGGCDVSDLAREFGTPLFIYDEEHIRRRCQEVYFQFGDKAAYATKAFLCPALAQVIHEEGLRFDATTIGEIAVILKGGVPADRIVMHGNNRSVEEFRYGMAQGLRDIVIDCYEDFERVEIAVRSGLPRPRVSIRVAPGVEVHTHEFLQTGHRESKFGFPISGGMADTAITQAEKSPYLDLVGLHFHLGSQILALDCFEQGIEAIAPFVTRYQLPELSLGGGLGAPYLSGETAPTIANWAEVIRRALKRLSVTSLITVEPGRAIVGPAAITVYSVGSVKRIPSGLTYVAVDGGYIDNPRPALYGSGYDVFDPTDVLAERPLTVAVVGKHCESGDVIVRNGTLPASVTAGDLIATPVTGAYGYAMGSNYNLLPRPGVLFVRDGNARQVIRRETLDDVLRCHVEV